MCERLKRLRDSSSANASSRRCRPYRQPTTPGEKLIERSNLNLSKLAEHAEIQDRKRQAFPFASLALFARGRLDLRRHSRREYGGAECSLG